MKTIADVASRGDADHNSQQLLKFVPFNYSSFLTLKASWGLLPHDKANLLRLLLHVLW